MSTSVHKNPTNNCQRNIGASFHKPNIYIPTFPQGIVNHSGYYLFRPLIERSINIGLPSGVRIIL